MISSLVHDALRLRGLPVYGIVVLLVFAEDAILAGLIAPGETAAVIGGVAAGRGHVSLTVMCVCVCAAAIAGDAVGYLAGRRWGPRLASSRLLRRREARVAQAEAFLVRRGGTAVFLGRFVAFLRTVIPFLAGSSGMHYGRFTAFNVAGGVLWGVGCVVVGFVAGDSYQSIERILGPATAGVVVALAVVAFVVWRVHRYRRETRDPE
jgi:membrane-associated protein